MVSIAITRLHADLCLICAAGYNAQPLYPGNEVLEAPLQQFPSHNLPQAPVQPQPQFLDCQIDWDKLMANVREASVEPPPNYRENTFHFHL